MVADNVYNVCYMVPGVEPSLYSICRRAAAFATPRPHGVWLAMTPADEKVSMPSGGVAAREIETRFSRSLRLLLMNIGPYPQSHEKNEVCYTDWPRGVQGHGVLR